MSKELKKSPQQLESGVQGRAGKGSRVGDQKGPGGRGQKYAFSSERKMRSLRGFRWWRGTVQCRPHSNSFSLAAVGAGARPAGSAVVIGG